MAAEVEAAPAKHHHVHEAPPQPHLPPHHPHPHPHPLLPHLPLPHALWHHHHYPPPPPPPPHHHHHNQHLPPPPFLCTRCKCWNFPGNPNFNSHTHPYHHHNRHPRPHLHPHTHSHESAVCLQDQESTDYQAKNISSDRCGVDEMGDDEDEVYEFVMTDEWMEFFAKSEARRQEKKRQQKKAVRDLRKATRARSQADDPSQHMEKECII